MASPYGEPSVHIGESKKQDAVAPEWARTSSAVTRIFSFRRMRREMRELTSFAALRDMKEVASAEHLLGDYTWHDHLVAKRYDAKVGHEETHASTYSFIMTAEEDLGPAKDEKANVETVKVGTPTGSMLSPMSTRQKRVNMMATQSRQNMSSCMRNFTMPRLGMKRHTLTYASTKIAEEDFSSAKNDMTNIETVKAGYPNRIHAEPYVDPAMLEEIAGDTKQAAYEQVHEDRQNLVNQYARVTLATRACCTRVDEPKACYKKVLTCPMAVASGMRCQVRGKNLTCKHSSSGS